MNVRVTIHSPPGEAVAFVRCRQHFVFDHLAPKTNKFTAERQYISESFRQVESELSTFCGSPIRIEVANDRKFSVIIGLKLINVSLIARANRINRSMNFNSFKAEKKTLVKVTDEIFEPG